MKRFLLSLTLLSVLTYSCSDGDKESTSSDNKTLLLMEEQVQKMSVIQSDRGNGFISDIKSEYMSTRGANDQIPKREKLKMVLDKTEIIDEHTAKLIEYIDQIKYQLIRESGENKKKLITRENSGVVPDLLNLYELKSPGAQAEIKDSIKLFRQIVAYREAIVFECANYSNGERAYRLPKIGSIRNYSSPEEFNRILGAKLSVETYNYREDKEVLWDLYAMLHNTSMKVVTERNTTLLTNLCLLSALQQEILSARALALAQWKSKVSTGEYAFDTIRAVVDGPEKVKLGSSASYTIFVAAIDSQQTPMINVQSESKTEIKNNDDGTYTVKIRPSKTGSTKLSGVIRIQNKSGIPKVIQWEKTIIVE